MTPGNLVLYIVVLFLIALTLFNLYAMLTSKRRRINALSSYRSEMQVIEEKLLKLMKERGLDFSLVRRFMNDRGNGIILASDPDKKKAAIAMKDDIELFSFSELEDAGAEYIKSEKGKPVCSKVFAQISGTRFEYTIGSRPFYPRSPLGKVVYETTEEFARALEKILEEGKEK